MRQSDEKNQPFKKYHDQQIYTDKHDQILAWLIAEFKNRKSGLLSVIEHGILDHGEEKFYQTGFNLHIERPILGKYGAEGFIDLAVEFFYSNRKEVNPRETGGLFSMIEVKTSVNVGETVRQINYYKSKILNHSYMKWFVCAPPFPLQHLFAEENIGFIEYRGQRYAIHI